MATSIPARVTDRRWTRGRQVMATFRARSVLLTGATFTAILSSVDRASNALTRNLQAICRPS